MNCAICNKPLEVIKTDTGGAFLLCGYDAASRSIEQIISPVRNDEYLANWISPSGASPLAQGRAWESVMHIFNDFLKSNKLSLTVNFCTPESLDLERKNKALAEALKIAVETLQKLNNAGWASSTCTKALKDINEVCK